MATPSIAPRIVTPRKKTSQIKPSARAWRTPGKAVVAYAWLVLGFLVLVVLWGAVVRATSSGAGCGAHWPLCNGDFFPHHPRLATVIEFTHRSMSGISTIMVLGLLVWTFLSTNKGALARRAAVFSGVLLLTEGGFGAVLVLRHYVERNISIGRVVMQSVHFTNTLLLLAAISLTAWFLHCERQAASNSSPERLSLVAGPRLRPIALAAVLSTIVVGATGSLAALADTLFPSTDLRTALLQDFAASAPLLVRMRWVHPAAAAIGLACVLLLALRLKSRIARTVGLLLVMQIVLGVLDVLLLAPTWMQILHLLGADIYWIALVLLAADVLWPGKRDPQPATI